MSFKCYYVCIVIEREGYKVGFERMIDRNLEPPEENIAGYDWKGDELYGNEYGYMIDGKFVIDDEVIEYMESFSDLVVSGDVMKIQKYDI